MGIISANEIYSLSLLFIYPGGVLSNNGGIVLGYFDVNFTYELNTVIIWDLSDPFKN